MQMQKHTFNSEREILSGPPGIAQDFKMTAEIDTGHQDMVHDIQLDYYGRRLATCSSDYTIKVFDVVGERLDCVADLLGHQGPVFEVAWGHPKFGNILASCGFDNRVIIWQEQQTNQWAQIHISQIHTASVNSLSFAPHELGFVLASASSDSSIGIITRGPEGFAEERIEDAHPVGALGVSFAPATSPGALVDARGPAPPERRLVSCGCDNAVKVWRWSNEGWSQEGPSLLKHTDWVRDVAWSPNLGLPSSTIASASQDGTVVLWSENLADNTWDFVTLPKFEAPVYRVSWSVTGHILAVSDGSNKVTLWKEAVDKKWQQINA